MAPDPTVPRTVRAASVETGPCSRCGGLRHVQPHTGWRALIFGRCTCTPTPTEDT